MRSHFTATVYLLFTIFLFSSCGAFEGVVSSSKYKKIHHKPTSKEDLAEIEKEIDNSIPAGPMDTEDSVFGDEAMALIDEEAQKLKRQKLVERRLALAKQQAKTAADEHKANEGIVEIKNKEEVVAEKNVTLTEINKTKTENEAVVELIKKKKEAVIEDAPKEEVIAVAEEVKPAVKKEKTEKISDRIARMRKAQQEEKAQKAMAKAESVVIETPTITPKVEVEPEPTPEVKEPVKAKLSEKIAINNSLKKEKQNNTEKATTPVEEPKVVAKVETPKATPVVEKSPEIEIPVEETTEKVAKTDSKMRKRLNRMKRKTNKGEAKETIVAVSEDAEISTEQDALNAVDVETAEPEAVVEEPMMKSFYFPVNQLTDAQAYQYVSKDAQPDTTYRLMKSLNFGGKTILVTEIYDKDFSIKKITREQVSYEGVYVRDYVTYDIEVEDADGITSISCMVDSDEGLNWDMENGDVVETKVSYQSSIFPNYYDISINTKRVLLDNNATVTYNGNVHSAMVFQDAESLIYKNHREEEETKNEITYTNKYAEGIGLVEFKVKEGVLVDSETTYELKDILSYTDWMDMTRSRKEAKGN